MSDPKPWKLRYRLATPAVNGQKVAHTAYASKESALHEGQRLFDSGCIAVTLTNDTLPANKHVVRTWTATPSTKRRRKR